VRGRAGRGDGDGGRLPGGGGGGGRDRDGECGDGEAGGHVLRAAAVDLASRDVHGADLAAGVGDVEGAVVVRERGPVGVAHGGQLLEGEGHGAVGHGEGGQLHGRHGDVRRARAEEHEQRRRRAAGGQEEEEDRHDAGRRGRGGGAVAGARGRVVLRRQPRRRSGHGGRPGERISGVLGGGAEESRYTHARSLESDRSRAEGRVTRVRACARLRVFGESPLHGQSIEIRALFRT